MRPFNGERILFNTLVFTQLDTHMQKELIWITTYTMYKNELKWIKHLHVRTTTEENLSINLSALGSDNGFLAIIPT
jgi:hypothetical protein